MSARSVSRWLLTETYSPEAMLSAPPTRAATPPRKISCRSAVAPAKPITIAATETMPSFAPRTAARSRLSSPFSESECGSSACWLISGNSPGERSAMGEDMASSSRPGSAVATKDRLHSSSEHPHHRCGHVLGGRAAAYVLEVADLVGCQVQLERVGSRTGGVVDEGGSGVDESGRADGHEQVTVEQGSLDRVHAVG